MDETETSKVVLITGSSSGFGFACALKLAISGYTVFATMRDTNKSEQLLGEAARKGCAHNIRIFPLDVTSPESIRSTVNEIIADKGVIDVLINNAGFGMGGFFEDLSPEDYQRQFDVNFFGVLNVTREVLLAMRPRRSGKIINITSMAAFAGTPCFSAYCSSKWALEGFSECLYMELKPFGINVALVEPGSYRTKIFEDNAAYAKNFDNPNSPYYTVSRYLRQVVLEEIRKNNRDPNEVAGVVDAIVKAHSPAFRNIVGWDQKIRCWLMRTVPFKVYAWIVNQILLKQG
jgi:NAD(P)-dependent dehydrogenase (short-subunit alcohol dehydrogenase family)